MTGDIAAGGSAFNAAADGTKLMPAAFAHVLANPPYLAAGRGTEPPDRLKASAHQMDGGDLDAWMRFLATAAAAGATATIIHRADALGALLSALDGRFGALKVFPIFPRTGAAASRVIVQGIKGSRAPMAVLPGLVLHDAGNAFRPEVEAILRHGAALDLGGERNSGETGGRCASKRGDMMQNSKRDLDPNHDPELTKTEARQGTGPRQMVSVLFVSITLAVVIGALLLAYFYLTTSPQPA